jgi:hypothetical protein
MEADAYFCFTYFLSSMKENYVKGYKGVINDLEVVKKIVQIGDKELETHFAQNNVQFFHFGFRWIFCLLLREFPITLSIK